MHLDPQNYQFLPMLGGMVRDDAGELRWPLIIGSIISAGAIAVGGFLVSVGNEVSAIGARQPIIMERLDKLETANHPATTKRYTSDDDARDQEIMRRALREVLEDIRKDIGEVNARMQRFEDRLRK
jgi:hypothetical protein